MAIAEKELFCLYAFIREKNIPKFPTDKYFFIFHWLALGHMSMPSMEAKSTFLEIQSSIHLPKK